MYNVKLYDIKYVKYNLIAYSRITRGLHIRIPNNNIGRALFLS